jgi:hypothetical protein
MMYLGWQRLSRLGGAGARGAHPHDTRGQEMAVMARVMGSRDQVIYDVVAFH